MTQCDRQLIPHRSRFSKAGGSVVHQGYISERFINLYRILWPGQNTNTAPCLDHWWRQELHALPVSNVSGQDPTGTPELALAVAASISRGVAGGTD